MPKSTTSSKHKYNKSAYRRYEFSVGVDTKLNYVLERYLHDSTNGLSELIKSRLAEYFGIDPTEIYVPYHLNVVNGKTVQILNPELDLLFESLPIAPK